ncbi:MAG: tyrosine-type recombinase/integrase [Burkholderiaceae bacterium]|nr:tyrosine-type recombinase/integrase [Burkholderiaceae bacterium]
MPRKAPELAPADVSALVRIGVPGKFSVGSTRGLTLAVRRPGVAVWTLRLRIDGRSTDRRLGLYVERTRSHADPLTLAQARDAQLTLAQARDVADVLRVAIAAGADPVTQRRAARKATEARANQKTFKEVANLAHADRAAGFKNAKHAAQWITTLETYAFPTLGEMPIADIHAANVADVLRPIWHNKPETASRVGQRIATVMRYGEAHGWTDRAPVKAAIEMLGPQKVEEAHHPALAVGDMPRFMAALRAAEGTGARALEFAILTAARSSEVRGARWHEVDLKARLWTVPGERMKRGRRHVIPLSDAAIALLRALPGGEPGGLIFPGEPQKRGRPRGRTSSGALAPLSDMTLLAVVRRLHEADTAADGAGFVDREQMREGAHPIATPHGVARSTFRDWCGETGVPRELAERALAHAVGDKTEAAYARSTLVEQRRPVMQAWGRFCTAEKGRTAPS